MASAQIWEPFLQLKRRNKVLFTVIVAAAIIIFWKGIWGLTEIVLGEWIFRGHLFWANLAAAIIGLAVLIAAGVVLDRLG